MKKIDLHCDLVRHSEKQCTARYQWSKLKKPLLRDFALYRRCILPPAARRWTLFKAIGGSAGRCASLEIARLTTL